MRVWPLLLILLLTACGAEPEEALEAPALEFQVAETYAVGAAPHGMQKQDNALLIAAAGDDKIEILDLESGAITARWDAPDTPLDLVTTPHGWLVTAFAGDYVHLLDTGGGATTMAWPVGKGPSLFAPDDGGEFLYVVSEFADAFTVFDREMGEVVATYKTGKRPYPADVTHDGVLAFVPSREDGTVTVLDLLNQEQVTAVGVCAEPLGGSLTVDEVSYVVACGGEDKVAFINTASLAVTHEIADGIGPRPFSVAVDAGERYAFVNNAGGDTVSVIDLATRGVIENIAVGEIPIALRVFDHTLYVASEGSNTVSEIPIPSKLRTLGGPPNEVIVLGMIHDGFKTSERYSSEVLKALIRRIDPDIVVTEIPPNRLDAAIRGFEETGRVTERRARVFPEYADVLFPLTREMDFEIVGAAAWNPYMNRYRSRALERIENDPARAGEWAEHRAAKRRQRDAIGNRWDDPLFIHAEEYDRIQKEGYGPYARYFHNDLGPGAWENINAAHYALIERALQKHMFKGKRILIMFGASHKYWFLEQLRQRDDIDLLDAKDFIRDLAGN